MRTSAISLLCPAVLLLLAGCQDGLTRKMDVASRGGPPASNAPAQVRWKGYFQEPQLATLIGRALDNNHDVKIAIARMDSARANYHGSRGALAPTLGLKAEGVRSRSGNNTDDDYSNTGRDLFTGFQASWELDLWGRLRSARGAALERLRASAEAKRLVEVNLVAELATAYYELKALDTTREILLRNEALQSEMISSVEAQVEAGKETSLALQQFRAQMKNLQAMRLEAEKDIVENEGVIRTLLGDASAAVPRGSSPVFQSRLPQLARGVPSAYIAHRPDVLAAEYELSAASGDVAAAKAAFYPTVTIDGMLGFQAFRANKLLRSSSLSHSGGGGLVAPLINRSAIKAEFDGATAAQVEALHTYQQTIVTGYVEIHNQLAGARLLERIENLKAEESKLLEDAVGTARELFDSGRTGYLEVLTAQSSLSASLEKVDLRKRRLQTAVSLYKAIGGG